jgi:branched-chain amino acid transport system substrate-binding protein
MSMKFRLLSLVLSVLLLAVGCSRPEPAPSPSLEPTPAPPARPVKVGVVLSLSGPAATYGQECLNGFKMAVDELNPARKQKLELEVIDDRGEASETQSAFNQLITAGSVDVLVGAVASTNTLAGAKLAEETHVPLLVPISTNDAITQGNRYVSRICFKDSFQGEALAKFGHGQLGKVRAAIITDKANDYSIGLAAAFRSTFTGLGGAVAVEESYTANDPDFTALIRAVKKASPDVIFIPGQYGDVGSMLRQARGHWDGIPKLGGDGWDSPTLLELAGADAAVGSYISSHFAADDVSTEVQGFVGAYRARFNAVPGAMACLGYDAGHVLAAAIDKATTPLSRDSLNAALRSTTGVKGVSGTITLNENGEAVKDAVILEVTPTGFRFKTRVAP